MSKIKVLFVCMGNICRSPTAEGVFTALVEQQKLADRFHIDSAGTHAYHVGDAPDFRAQKAALERGVDLQRLRARKICVEDFEAFDHVLVMDGENYLNVQHICPPEYKNKIAYFLDYAPQLSVREVPDPYYGNANGFDRVLDLVETASEGFINALRKSGDL